MLTGQELVRVMGAGSAIDRAVDPPHEQDQYDVGTYSFPLYSAAASSFCFDTFAC